MLPAKPRPAPRTIYVGGGTPSILPASSLERLLQAVSRRVDLRDLREWTVEANPGTLSEEKLALLRRAGVTRISLGVQSLDDGVLRRLGRRHSAADVEDAVRAIRRAGIPEVALDLIAAIPDVTGQAWRETLRRCVALDPDHLSVYCLTIEPGTALHRARRRGAFHAVTEEQELKALRGAERILADAGYRRYEISNYARRGHECLHNLAFWQGGDYLGFGPAAATRSGLLRWTHRPDLSAYLASLESGRPAQRAAETLRAAQDAAERLAFAFRLTGGVRIPPAGWPSQQQSGLKAALRRLQTAGLLRPRRGRWIPTRRGLDIADAVTAVILELGTEGTPAAVNGAVRPR
jgi:oxygen-independent coproporphyrinogen-3 oxidase